jgi:hypothetical protein
MNCLRLLEKILVGFCQKWKRILLGWHILGGVVPRVYTLQSTSILPFNRLATDKRIIVDVPVALGIFISSYYVCLTVQQNKNDVKLYMYCKQKIFAKEAEVDGWTTG